ncbi:hypothetical protein ACLOJK_026127 [Asimina triloba]
MDFLIMRTEKTPSLLSVELLMSTRFGETNTTRHVTITDEIWDSLLLKGHSKGMVHVPSKSSLDGTPCILGLPQLALPRFAFLKLGPILATVNPSTYHTPGIKTRFFFSAAPRA